MNGQHPSPGRLDAYLLADLDEASRQEVEAHLQECQSCREQIASLQSALAAYQHTEPALAAEAALDRLLDVQRIRNSRPRITKSRRVVHAAVAAAAAAVIFLGGFWTGRSQDTLRGIGLVAPAIPAPADQPRRPAIDPPPLLDQTPPPVVFAVADLDRLGRPAFRDTTWN